MLRYHATLLEIDIGTSGVKTLLIESATGRTLAQALQVTQPDTPQPGQAEQDPEMWVGAAAAVAREVLTRSGVSPGSVAGIGLSGQMHTAVLLDKAGGPLGPALLWLDQRSAPQVEQLQAQFGREQLGRWTSNPVFAGLTLPALLWLREHEPECAARVAIVLQPKDYVRWRLTRQLSTDLTDASATGLLDTGRRCWSAELLSATGLAARLLPPLLESGALAGNLQPEMASALNLPAGIPLACGAGDQAAQALGNAILEPGTLSCTIGTGGQLFAVAAEYRPDPALRLHTFCHAVPGRWHWLAASLTAGLALRWLRDEVLGGRLSYGELADGAAQVEPGADGLVFLPFLAGDRTPHMNPRARGAFAGLTLRHNWQQMARAVMEGVLFSLRDGLALIQELGAAETLVASGGGTRHPLWLRLQADILGIPVQRSATQEAAALGAALLAGVAAGIYPTVNEAAQQAQRRYPQATQSDPAVQPRYNELYSRYRLIAASLAPTWTPA